jgi:hypothetical protein
MKFPAFVALTVAALFAAGPAGAKPKDKPQAAPALAAAPGPAIPDCPRAAYKGDPVCFGENDARNLPTPSAGAIWREKSDDVHLGDGVTVSGADPEQMKKTPVDQYLNNPNPNPRKQKVGGGAAVNYKF